MSIINFMMNGENEDANLILFFIPIFTLFIIYLGFYLSGFIAYCKQLKYREWIEEKLKIGLFVPQKAELYLDSFTIKPIRQNHDAVIHIKPKSVTFEVLELEDTILILGYVFDYGIFKRHIRPIVISKKHHKTYLKEGAVLQNTNEIKKLDNQIRINFEKSFEGIKSLIIKKSEN